MDYDARLSIDSGRGASSGFVRIRLKAGPGVDVIPLTARVRVHEVRLDDRIVNVRTSSDTVFVPLDAASGPNHLIEIAYETTGARGLTVTPTEAFTIFDTPSWLPVHWSISDRATLSLSVELPAGWKLHAVGAPNEGGWRLDEPMPPYLFGFAAGRLREVRVQGDRDLRVLASDSAAGRVPRLMQDLPRMIDFLERISGIPFPLQSYTQVFMPGATPQELATFTILPAAYAATLAADSTEDHLLLHEVAHQWWGNRITAADWSHFWLQEGVVTFLVAAWKNERWGARAYEREIELARGRVERARANGRGRALVDPSIQAAESAGGTIPYSMGMLVLHQLRREVGEDAFWAGFRSFSEQGMTHPVTTDDLRVAMEAASGRSLASFFESWVYAPAPDLAAIVIGE